MVIAIFSIGSKIPNLTPGMVKTEKAFEGKFEKISTTSKVLRMC